MVQLRNRPVRADALDRVGIDHLDVPGQVRERIGEFTRHPCDTFKVARPAVDRCPALDLRQHRGLIDPADRARLVFRQ